MLLSMKKSKPYPANFHTVAFTSKLIEAEATNMADSDRERSRLDQVRDFCTDTTAHGLGRIAAAKSWPARLFWIVIFVVASLYSVTQIHQSCVGYFSFPTKTDVSLINKEQLMFPAVTVCNINPFKLSELRNTSLLRDMASISFIFIILCITISVHFLVAIARTSLNY